MYEICVGGVNKAEMKEKSLLGKTIGLGGVSIFSYLASYYSRNLLSVATPAMLATGDYTSEFLGLLTSVYFLVYASGQLINGMIGDTISPKYMLSVGLTLTGLSLILFPLVPFAWLQIACFAVMGVGLSMLRGPIMKMVSENLSKDHARAVCTLLSVSSFAGPLVASMLAIVFQWNTMFIVAGIATLCIGMIAFFSLSVFERKGTFVFHGGKKSVLSGCRQLFRIENFIFYLIVGGVVEISGSAITFWIPTYLSNALYLDSIITNTLYSIMSVISSLAPFMALFVFKLTKERDIAMMRGGFLIAVVAFMSMMFAPAVWPKIICLIIAKFSLACCSSVLWSIYIPGMGKTGKVSSINGVINCAGYLSASIANTVFASLLGLSWTGVIGVWCGIAAVGLVASLLAVNKNNGQT